MKEAVGLRMIMKIVFDLMNFVGCQQFAGHILKKLQMGRGLEEDSNPGNEAFN